MTTKTNFNSRDRTTKGYIKRSMLMFSYSVKSAGTPTAEKVLVVVHNGVFFYVCLYTFLGHRWWPVLLFSVWINLCAISSVCITLSIWKCRIIFAQKHSTLYNCINWHCTLQYHTLSVSCTHSQNIHTYTHISIHITVAIIENVGYMQWIFHLISFHLFFPFSFFFVNLVEYIWVLSERKF